MMSFQFSSRAPLETLHSMMRGRVEGWLESTDHEGISLLVYCTVRTAFEQSLLYRRNRTLIQIHAGVSRLQRLGMDLEAGILEETPPQLGSRGRKLTNALPGLSWHQPKLVCCKRGALALDFVPMLGGKAQWEDHDMITRAGELAEECGLTWSGRWKRFRELVHVQYDNGGAWNVVDAARGLYAGGV